MSLIYSRYRGLILPLALWSFSLILVSVQSYQHKAVPSPFSRAVAEILSYPERAYNYFTDALSRLWNHYLYLREVEKENLRLQKELAYLLVENQALKEQALENQRLKALLEFKSELKFRSVPAKIISWDLSSYARTLKINVGFKEGIKKGQAVISPQGLVGQIIEEPGPLAGAHWSQVLLITDPTSRVSVVIERTRDQGIVEGRGEEKRLLLKYLSPEAKPLAGDVVVTSGLGGIFPGGIKVGEVVKVEENPFSISPQCWVKPSADFSRLEEVLVLISEGEK